MAEELSNFKLQLQQVAVALINDPDNEDLLKLKADFDEIINLQEDLIQTQLEEQRKYVQPSSSGMFDEKFKEQKYNGSTSLKIWKVGDNCMAKFEDAQYYQASIEAITDDGEVTVLFSAYQNRGTCSIKDLKEYKDGESVFQTNNNKLTYKFSLTLRRVRVNQKEYLKKKREKKQQRLKDMEEVREVDKNSWLKFNTKSGRKQKIVQKSIFQTPDSVSGRVGVGTCGVGGKEMTKQNAIAGKYKKGV
ncbi:unnamed protein product [Diamesa serratosioi]